MSDTSGVYKRKPEIAGAPFQLHVFSNILLQMNIIQPNITCVLSLKDPERNWLQITIAR